MTDGLSVLLFYDIHIDSGTTLNFSSACVFVNVEPYRPTITVLRHHHRHCWLCSYCHIIHVTSSMHLAFYKSSIPRVHSTGPFHKSIPRVHSIPCSAFYTLPSLFVYFVSQCLYPDIPAFGRFLLEIFYNFFSEYCYAVL